MRKKIKFLIPFLFITLLIFVWYFPFYSYGAKENIVVENNPYIIHEVSEIDNIIKELTLEEKIGQLLLVMAPAGDKEKAIKDYHIGGYILGYNEIENHNPDSLKEMILSYNSKSKIPLNYAIDEEGGTVTRLSYNENLYQGFFESPKQIYKMNGYDGIIDDTRKKSELLENLGFTINLAPVADVATKSNSYMWYRSFSNNYEETAKFISTVIETSKNYNVSYVVKHFPGHGDYEDPHLMLTKDNKSLEEYETKDLLPFISAIKSEAEIIMVDHIIMTALDSENPVSLSKKVMDYLKSNLDYKGLIMTDCLSMINVDNKYSKALKAGADIIIVKDYKKAVFDIQRAVVENEISEEMINEKIKKILENKLKNNVF